MLVDQPATATAIRQLVLRLPADRSLREDLAQEAIIHLWLTESHRPGQQPGWYFQSCRYHLLNLLRLGRSVDARKHQSTLQPFTEMVDCPDASADDSALGRSVPALVSARETLALLRRCLDPLALRILDLLVAGHTVRCVARLLGVSHTAILRERRRIARLALSCGIEPLPHHAALLPPPSPPSAAAPLLVAA